MKTFKEFYAEKHGRFPGFEGEHYYTIMARIMDTMAEYIDYVLAEKLK